MSSDDEREEREREEWEAVRKAHWDALNDDPVYEAEIVMSWETLRQRQRAWQEKMEQRLLRGDEIAQAQLENEWAAIRASQCLEAGTLSPAGRERLALALLTSDFFRSDKPHGEIDYAVTAIEVSAGEILDDHLRFINRVSGRPEFPDARWRAWRKAFLRHHGVEPHEN